MIRDQEEAGLDIVTDGQMSYDDYVGVIGSFCWYMYERIGGFEPAREPHPSEAGVEGAYDRVMALIHDWGGVINSGPVTHGPIRLRDLYEIAKPHDRPADQGVGRRRPGQPRLARPLQALQGRRRSSATRSRRSSTPR